MKRFSIGLLVMFFTFTCIHAVNAAEETVFGVDEATKQDKILLHGTVVDLNGRTLHLKDVNPLCRRVTSFLIRNFDSHVPIVKGGTTWFWMIGNCRSKDSFIDIIAQPEGS